MPDSPAPASCAAILVAAGASRRMGFDKLAAPLGGLPVLRRSLEALLAAPGIDEVVVVCPADRESLWAWAATTSTKPVTRVDGGASRQESVARGLAAIAPGCRWIAVHDGARPLVSPADIDHCLTAAARHGAATLAHRATDTMKRADAEDFCIDSVKRDDVWCMETPQVFAADLLRDACRQAAASGLELTDEVSAVQAFGARVKFVESASPNPKITTPSDLVLAEALLHRP